MMEGTTIQPGLFPIEQAPRQERFQVWTPVSEAVALWERFFGGLGAGSHVWEPACGVGNMALAVPESMDLFCSEIDLRFASMAATKLAGRARVVQGDYRTVPLPWPEVDAIFGNPPWIQAMEDALLERAWQVLRPGGVCGLLLPANYTQYAAKVCELMERGWSIESVEIPRDVFPSRLQEPVTFKLFIKDRLRRMVGMFLAVEVAARRALETRYQAILRDHAGTWLEAVAVALKRLGGSASLSTIYAELAGRRRPSQNEHWKEKVRQVLQIGRGRGLFKQESKGVWALA